MRVTNGKNGSGHTKIDKHRHADGDDGVIHVDEDEGDEEDSDDGVSFSFGVHGGRA